MDARAHPMQPWVSGTWMSAALQILCIICLEAMLLLSLCMPFQCPLIQNSFSTLCAS